MQGFPISHKFWDELAKDRWEQLYIRIAALSEEKMTELEVRIRRSKETEHYDTNIASVLLWPVKQI